MPGIAAPLIRWPLQSKNIGFPSTRGIDMVGCNETSPFGS